MPTTQPLSSPSSAPAPEPLPFGRPLLGHEERDLIEQVLASGQLVHGAMTQRFEASFAEFVGGGHAVALASATAALHLGLFVRGLGPGDSAIVPALTHPATAHAVELTGASAIFVDVDPFTGNLAADQLDDAAARARQQGLNLKAILPVHYLGLPAAMDSINAFAKQEHCFVLEDCALALGSRYRGQHAGLIGHAGCFSFYPVKQMTSVEGGMFLTNDAALADQVRKARSFGYDKALGERALPGIYDVDRLGFNYRMNEVEAAVGLAQLGRLPGFLETRRVNDDHLRGRLAAFPKHLHLPPAGLGEATSGRYCLTVVLNEATCPPRDDVARRLRETGVGYSIHYPGPVPRFRYYREKYQPGPQDFPVATRWSAQLLSLPVGPHLGIGDMDRVADSLIQALA